MNIVYRLPEYTKLEYIKVCHFHNILSGAYLPTMSRKLDSRTCAFLKVWVL